MEERWLRRGSAFPDKVRVDRLPQSATLARYVNAKLPLRELGYLSRIGVQNSSGSGRFLQNG
jgi:hypothetical protein